MTNEATVTSARMGQGSLYPTIIPREVPKVVRSLARVYDSLFLHGGSGVGKSDILGTLCSDVGLKKIAWDQFSQTTGEPIPPSFPDLELVHLVLPQLDSEDFVGVPFHRRILEAAAPALEGAPPREERVTAYAPMEHFVGHSPKILLLDEVPAAEIRTMKVLLQIVNERKIAGKSLTPGTVSVMAGNRQSDRAANKQVPFTLGNRASHRELITDASDWLVWASHMEMIPWPFLAYVRQHREGALHNFSQSNPSLAQLTPRSYAKAAMGWASFEQECLAESGSGVLTEEDVNGLAAGILSKIGSVDGAKLNAFLRLHGELPTWEEIVETPLDAKLPQRGDISTMYYLIGLLIDRFSAKDISDKALDGAVAYWNRAMTQNPDSVDASAWLMDSLFLNKGNGAPDAPAKAKIKSKTKPSLEGNISFRLASRIMTYPAMKAKLSHFIEAAQAGGVWTKM